MKQLKASGRMRKKFADETIKNLFAPESLEIEIAVER
jgi:hypothetical protein